MKIDLDWIKKELDAGREVELECVDRIGFLKDIDTSEANEKILDQGPLEVDHIDYEGDIRLVGEIIDIYLNVIVSGEFKYFRIKRTSNYDPIEGEGTLPSLNLQGKGTPIYSEINFQNSDPDLSDKPTFKDLIDVATQAWKDGYLKVLEFERCGVEQIFTVIGENAYRWHEGDSDYGHAVDLINSLYTETFVIKSMEDIDNIKWDKAKAVLTNGCELDLNILDGAVNRSIMLRLLKGATVTQNRGK